MKRIGNLYEKIISIENLQLADEKARKGKRHTYGVRVHDENREANILALHEALKNHTFTTSKYETFTIFEPKERLIFRLPYYPDRIVHHAVMNVLKPIWTSIFISSTYSCIEGRGIGACRKKVQQRIRNHKGKVLYCLKFDIRKFYPSIDHDVLKRIVRKKIKDPDLLWLLDNIIDSAEGLPIGNYLSQFLANLVLSYLDHVIKEEWHVKDYDRYADDGTILGETKEELHALRKKIAEYLHTELKLDMKDNWQVFKIAKDHRDKSGRGLDFVGFVFYMNETRIRKQIKVNFCRACAKANHHPELTDREYKMRIASWLGWAKYSNSDRLTAKILRPSVNEKVSKQRTTALLRAA